MEEKARIFAGFVLDNAIVRVSGHATWQIAPALKKFEDANQDRLLNSLRLVFDLSLCTFLDSTMIGLLSHLAVRYLKKNNRQASLLYGTEKVRNILELMNCHRILALVPSDPSDIAPGDDIKELPAEAEVERATLREAMLVAHKALVELTDENLSRFDQVINDLEHPHRPGPPPVA